jgi:hypothetical protein
MKHALATLIRTVIRARDQRVTSAQLPELTVAQLRQVSGGADSTSSPRGTW